MKPNKPKQLSMAGLLQEQGKLDDFLALLTEEEHKRLTYQWSFWGRPAQQFPKDDNWTTFLLGAGRGFGKSRTVSELVRILVQYRGYRRVALIGPTQAATRDVMVLGESGIMATCPSWFRPVYKKSGSVLEWPNGAISPLYSAEEPDRLRGPQFDAGACDELCAWKRPQETWDMFRMGLRLGKRPIAIVATTPRPIKLYKDLLTDPTTRVTHGSTYENRENLAKAFVDSILRKYEGTRLGRQELEAELLGDVPGALWTYAGIEEQRLEAVPVDLVRIVVAVDPAATSGEGSDNTGVVVMGLGSDGKGYVLDDLSTNGKPSEWARVVLEAVKKWNADCVVAETNQGGEMVGHVLRSVVRADEYFPRYRTVHASRGKYARAEPISALYEQKRIYHVGSFKGLEDQMCNFVPGVSKKSPDSLDAMVWAAHELFPNLAAPGSWASALKTQGEDFRPIISDEILSVFD